MERQLLSEVRVRGGIEVGLFFNTQTRAVELEVLGDLELLELASEYRRSFKSDQDVQQLVAPAGESRAARLLREAVLRAQGKWHPPYVEEEICHCRLVPTERVWDAIRSGAKTGVEVSQMTSATTACGSCGPDVRALIDYYHQRT